MCGEADKKYREQDNFFLVVVSEWFYISQVIFPAKFGFDKKVV